MSLLKTGVMEWLRSHPGGPNLIGSKSDLVIKNDFEDNTDLKGIGGGLTELTFVCSCGTENGITYLEINQSISHNGKYPPIT